MNARVVLISGLFICGLAFTVLPQQRSMVEIYGQLNISLQQAELASMEDVDLLRNFSEACRLEFEQSLEV